MAGITLLALTAGAASAADLIENQATTTYRNLRLAVNERVDSNRVQATVAALREWACEGGREATIFPGQLVNGTIACSNSGNRDATLTLNMGISDGLWGLGNIHIFRDMNGDGEIRVGEPEIKDNSRFTLPAGATLAFNFSGAVPTNYNATGSTLVSFSDGAVAETLEFWWQPQSETPSFSKEIVSVVAAPGGQVRYRVVAINSTHDVLPLTTLNVDGNPFTGISIDDPLPPNTHFHSVESSNGNVVYHVSGDPDDAFRVVRPADTTTIDRVAILRAGLLQGQVLSAELELALTDAAHGTVRNDAEFHYGDDDISASAEFAVQSNSGALNFLDEFGNYSSAVRRNQAFVGMAALLGGCNADRNVPESAKAEVRSLLAGDAETVVLTESGANTGLFLLGELPVVGPKAAIPGDGKLQVADNDTVHGTASCATQVVEAAIPALSLVRLFDARNGSLLAGVSVLLESRDSPDFVLTEISGADGDVHFGTLPAGTYRIIVQPSPGYRAPSLWPQGLLDAIYRVDSDGSYGDWFEHAGGELATDIPLDRVGLSGLVISKTANRDRVKVGGLVRYTIEIGNRSNDLLRNPVLEDVVPFGFRLLPDSPTLDGEPVQLEVIDDGSLRLALEHLTPGQIHELSYVLQVGAAAVQGDGINRAVLTAEDSIGVSSAASVEIDIDPLAETALIIGRVFQDCDADGMPGPDDLAVPAARIYMEDGQYALADARGNFHFEAVTARRHVLRLDPLSVPAGSTVAVLSARQANEPWSRFVDPKRGELQLVNFALSSCTASLAADNTATGPIEDADPADLLHAADPAQLPYLAQLPDERFFARRNITLQAIVAQGATAILSVNGQTVGADRIGLQLDDAERRLTLLQYVGVSLQPGQNEVLLRQIDAFGNPRGEMRYALRTPGDPAALRMTVLPAGDDGGYQVHVATVDGDGYPSASSGIVTLSTSAGTLTAADERAPTVRFAIGGTAALSAPLEAGTLRLDADFNGLHATRNVLHGPGTRPLIANGVIEAQYDRGRPTHDGADILDGFEDTLPVLDSGLAGDNATIGGRAALFLKGRIRGDWLLALTYDSDKPADELAIDKIDPEAYYPVYGDEGEQGTEISSSSKLYVLLQKNGTQYLYGDFETETRGTFQVGAFRRLLTGLRVSNTSSDGYLGGFAAPAKSITRVTEIPANGTSGPYVFSSELVKTGAERVSIIIRDRDLDSLVVDERELLRFSDYSINYLDGTILLTEPLPSVDENFNNVALRVRYDSLRTEADGVIAGAEGGMQVGAVRLAARAVHADEDDGGRQLLASRMEMGTRESGLSVEVANSFGPSGENGAAVKAAAAFTNDTWKLSLDAVHADAAFANPDSSVRSGVSQAEVQVRRQLTEKVSLRVTAKRSESSRDAERVIEQRESVQVDTRLNHGAQLAVGAYRATENSKAFEAAQVGLHWQPPQLAALSLNTELTRSLNNASATGLRLGAEYRISEALTVYGKHEALDGIAGAFGYATEGRESNSAFGARSQLGSHTQMYSEYRIDDAIDARRHEAVNGVRADIPLNDTLRWSGSFERISPVSGDGDTSMAIATSFAWQGAERWKSSARAEYRRSDSDKAFLASVVTAIRLNDDWTGFLKSNHYVRTDLASGVRTPQRLHRLGLAYRPLDNSRLNWLLRLEQRTGDGGREGDLDRSLYLNTDAIYAASARQTFTVSLDAHQVDATAGDVTARDSAWMLGARYLRDLNDKWSVGLYARHYQARHSNERLRGYGTELTRTIGNGLRLGVGYNWAGFDDAVFAARHKTSRGWFVNFSAKFDESWFGWLQ